MCSLDVVHWLRHWGWTYDPREPYPSLPFDPFPRQVEFLRWLEAREAARENGLAEKSRDMGVTWLCVAYALHGWLFRPGFAAGFGSRKLELVDNLGDPDSILEKARLLLDRLPAWMLPPGYARDEHALFCKIRNPATGATLTGEGGDDLGRGGRQTVYFVDEAAHLPRPQAVEASLSQTTRVRIDVSTPRGPGNPFYRKRHSGRVPVFTFHWRDDPRKGPEWYEREKARLGDPVVVAQELDIDYSASVEGVCIPGAWVRAAVGLALPPGKVRVAGWDVAEEGPDRNVLILRAGPVLLPPVEWGHMNTTATTWRAVEEATRLGASALFYDSVGPGMGVKGTLASSTRRLPFVTVAVNGGSSPSDTVWPDGRSSKERFLNLRAELFWLLRARFERAYEYVTQGVPHAPEDMVSLPDCPQLIADLSLFLYSYTDTGKLKIESKADMRRRGVKSPDYADAAAYCFAPQRRPGAPAAGGAPPPHPLPSRYAAR